jgi:uncharacterized membrane-anchored protein YitT (DUF2179 family)
MKILHRNNESAQLDRRSETWASTATHHAPWEDAQGIGFSIFATALALSMLEHLGLMTGGIAGLALIGFYLTGIDTGLLFFLGNMPFYILGVIRMGWAFTLKSFAAVAVLSVLVGVQGAWISYDSIHPLYGAIVAGVLIGFGLLGMFRHRASLGGVGILALFLQDRFGFRAGLTQLLIDAAIFALALATMDTVLVAYSFAGAVVLNLFLTVNHRTDRYIAR